MNLFKSKKVGFIDLKSVEQLQESCKRLSKSSWFDAETQRHYYGRTMGCGGNAQKLTLLEKEITKEVALLKERFEASGAFKVRY